MGSKVGLYVILALFLLASLVEAQPGVFDVTKFGAKPDEKTDTSQALVSAWKEACASAIPAKIVIPKGIFSLTTATLGGPCKAPITVQLDGTLKAPAGSTGEIFVQFENIQGFTLSGPGTFDGQGQAAWTKNSCSKDADCEPMPYNLRFNFITNGLVEGVTSLNSKNFHVNVLGCKNFTFQHFTVSAPATSINTDGIHIGRSTGVNITDTKIGTGDDCISIGDGAQQVGITNVECGPGHGISVGSLGRYPKEEPVAGIFVKNCTLSNTENGLRIKSWPGMETGSATDMHFEDITVTNVGNPILIDQMYCPYNQCKKNAASNVKISNVSFKNVKGTSTTPEAVTLQCSSGIPCNGVELIDVDLTYNGKEAPAKSVCTNVKPKVIGKLNPAGC